jgi:NAD(P)H-flavin reductase
MYKFVLEKMKSAGVPDENIYLSLERRMHCGVGVCQHCAVGSFYTCKDGPVFKYADIKNIPGAI